MDPASGIVTVTSTDISINGGRGSIYIKRMYRTLSNNPGPFGIGTSHNYGYQLALNQGQGQISLIMPDGNQFPFNLQSNGSFTNAIVPSLRGAVLTANQSAGTYVLRWRDGTAFGFQRVSQFATQGILTSITGPNGNTVSLVPNPSVPVQILKIIDPVGRTLNLSYDGFNRITSITDPIGRNVQYTYNSLGTLASFTDVTGGVTNYTYITSGSRNLLTQVTDPRGVITEQNTYNLQSTQVPCFDTVGPPAPPLCTSPPDFRILSQVQADGGVLSFEYQRANPLVSTSPILKTVVTDALGNKTTHRYDPRGLLLSVTDALGRQTTLVRDPAHNNLVAAYKGSRSTGDVSYTFDDVGNVLTRTDQLGNVTKFTYDLRFNKVTSVTDPLGNVSKLTYDSVGNLLTSTDPNSRTTSFTYNSFGQIVQATDPLGLKATFSYDAFGNLGSATDPLGNTTSMVYDALSRRIKTIDALGRTSGVAYDALGRVLTQTDPQNNTAKFSYDAVGNLLSVSDAKGNKTSFTYDAMSRLASKTDPLGKSDTRAYDKNGNLVKYTDRRGQTNQFTYDAVDRLAGEVFQDGSTVSRAYDANGRLVSVNDSVSGIFSFKYDPTGHLLGSVNPAGAVNYAYDADGRLTSRQVTGQSPVQYTYDAVGNVLSTSLPQATANFSYDSLNRLTSITRGNGVSSQYAYDSASRLMSITHSGGQGIQIPLAYTYDNVNNRASYASNLTQFLLTQSVSNTHNANNELLASSSSGNTISNSFDANGNLISSTDSSGTTTYTWDSRNRLARITAANGQTTNFLYDFAGNLLQQVDAGPSVNVTQTFVLDGTTNVAYVSRSDGDQYSVLSGVWVDGNLATIHANGQTEYGLTDAINSTIATADQSGVLRGTFQYEPFGQTTAAGSTYPFQYTGRVPVSSSLYYYRSRYYDPSAGRFISEDPVGFSGSSMNFYAYAANSPVTYSDPTGFAPVPAPPGPPPVPVPGGGEGSGWKWNPDPGNSRGGSWGPQKPIPGQSQPSGSWDPEGHWDVDNGLGERQRYTPDGRPISPEEAHGKCPDKTPDKTPDTNTQKMSDPDFMDRMSKITGLTGTALIIYLIISEGSRLFPPRNLVPVP